MKKQSIYIRLQNQYKKLNSRIQKSIKNGRFYNYTQFKQQQLLGRLKRYSLQLKQVAAGIAVVGALGVATPATAQYVPPAFMRHDSAANPLETLLPVGNGEQVDRPVFVDIDGDGDYDMFSVQYFFDGSISYGYDSRRIKYYENQGTVYSPSFVAVTGATNPLDSVIQFQDIEFVDIDNDGDLDLFAGASPTSYYNPTPTSVYFENVGSATNPNFVQQLGTSNPLNVINSDLSTNGDRVKVSFVDIDNDGDKDCFAVASQFSPSAHELWYYKNEGSISNPSFVKQIPANNPLDAMNSMGISLYHFNLIKVEFYDMDKDGDKDAFILGKDSYTHDYLENTGTATVPSFGNTLGLPGDPLDSLGGTASGPAVFLYLIDIDNDGDLDGFSKNDNSLFWENLDSTVLNVSSIREEEQSFMVYPNPTVGLLTFEKAISGAVVLYAITGEKLLEYQLENRQQLDLSSLENGLYFLYIETDKMRIRKKVLIQK